MMMAEHKPKHVYCKDMMFCYLTQFTDFGIT